MTITSIDPLKDYGETNRAILNAIHDHGDDMSSAVYAAVANWEPNAAVNAARCAEAFYAAAKTLGPGDARDALAVACAQLADFCSTYQIKSLGQTDRSLKMSGACRRIVGLGDQSEDDDPDPLPQFADG